MILAWINSILKVVGLALPFFLGRQSQKLKQSSQEAENAEKDASKWANRPRSYGDAAKRLRDKIK